MSYPKSHHLQPEKYPKMEGHCTASGKSCLSDTHLAVTERGSTAAGQHSRQYTKETESSAFRLGFHNQWSELCVFSETPLADSHWDPAPASSSGYTAAVQQRGHKKGPCELSTGKKGRYNKVHMEDKDKATDPAGWSSPSELCVQLRDTAQAWTWRVSGCPVAIAAACSGRGFCWRQGHQHRPCKVKELQMTTKSPPAQCELPPWLAAGEEGLAWGSASAPHCKHPPKMSIICMGFLAWKNKQLLSSYKHKCHKG